MIIFLDDELIKALAAKDKMKSDADKAINENAGLWKDEIDDLKGAGRDWSFACIT